MKIETVDYTASDAGDRLARSLRETGFAVLANHPIRADRIDEAYALWGGFFASDSKLNYLRDYEKQDGYFPFKSEHAKDAQKKDLKEFYHVYPWTHYFYIMNMDLYHLFYLFYDKRKYFV